ncbi:ABC transporter substrate-binding protein, partial [Streptomyces sp. NPDC059506]|uniref:ABC transporter substrate-binding protein n=1 Tax=Streptomyces sp. NPDC059506 TaxID=3347751 RepID=UPI0036A7CDDF
MHTDRTAPPRSPRLRRALSAALVLPLLLGALAACGYGSKAPKDDAAPAAAGGRKLSAGTVRIGHFANVTHATPLVGLAEGLFAKELGGTRISTQVFNAGPSEIEALNAGSVDIGWIGPSPAVNGYTRAGGKNLRIVSGSASGGVSLVVAPERVKGPHDLRGKRIATPQLGNTQDVALLNHLAEEGYEVDPATGRGDVTVLRVDNKETPTLFERGDIDGAWVPEPTASKLVASGGKVLLDEKELWEDGEFVITNVVVSRKFLAEHPDVVEAVLRGSVRTNAWIAENPEKAKEHVNASLKRLTGKALPPAVHRPAVPGGATDHDPHPPTPRLPGGPTRGGGR